MAEEKQQHADALYWVKFDRAIDLPGLTRTASAGSHDIAESVECAKARGNRRGYSIYVDRKTNDCVLTNPETRTRIRVAWPHVLQYKRMDEVENEPQPLLAGMTHDLRASMTKAIT